MLIQSSILRENSWVKGRFWIALMIINIYKGLTAPHCFCHNLHASIWLQIAEITKKNVQKRTWGQNDPFS